MVERLNVGTFVTGLLALCGSIHQLLLTFTFPSTPDMLPRLLDNVPIDILCLTHEECIPPDKSVSEPDIGLPYFLFLCFTDLTKALHMNRHAPDMLWGCSQLTVLSEFRIVGLVWSGLA
jgi:hypothetical protein